MVVELHHFTRHALVIDEGESASGSPGGVLRGSAGAFWSASRCAVSKTGGSRSRGSGVYLATASEVFRASLDGIETPDGSSKRFVEGKEGVLLPFESPRQVSVAPVRAFAHRFEVQGLSTRPRGGDADAEIVASVDSSGSLCVCEFWDKSVGAEDASASSLVPERSYQAAPPSAYAMELGWAGVALGTHQPTKAVVARHFPKDLSLFDGDLLVRQMKTIQSPTAIESFSEDVYVVAQKNKIGIYDLRGGERQGLVQCLPVNNMVTCMATGSFEGEPVVATGIGRTVGLWDARMWHIKARISGVFRQEVCGVEFLRAKPGCVCLTSVSGEVKLLELSPRVRENRMEAKGKPKFTKAASLTGDSRWIGLGTGTEVVSGEGGERRSVDRCIGLGVSGGLYSFSLS